MVLASRSSSCGWEIATPRPGAALAILVSYWLLYGGLVVTPGFLVGAGRARAAGLVFACAAALNLVLALVLTPELGLEGPALATAIPFFLAFPLLLSVGLDASGAPLGELARRAWLPAYRSASCWPGCSSPSGSASSPRRWSPCC